MHILVTGAAGYIGASLVLALLARGDRVTALDSMLFGSQSLAGLLPHPQLKVCPQDVRTLGRGDLTGVHAVVSLAGVSSELAAEVNPLCVDEINHHAPARLAQLARSCGVPRFLLISTCAVYGHAHGHALECSEASRVRPLTHHAQSSLRAEAALLSMAAQGFFPTVLRLGVVHGQGVGRTRYDLMLNAMVLSALHLGRMTLDNAGVQVNNHLHLRDAVGGIMAALQAPTHVVDRQVFNIGHHNLTASQVAEAIRDVLGGGIQISPSGGVPDLHHYRICLHKARDALNFCPQESLAVGVQDVLAALLACSGRQGLHMGRWIQEVLAQGREARMVIEHAGISACAPARAWPTSARTKTQLTLQ